MADTYITLMRNPLNAGGAAGDLIPIKAKDNGDGTYSLTATVTPPTGGFAIETGGNLASIVSNGVKDNGPAWTSVHGVSGAAVALTDTTVTAITDAPASGQKIIADDILISTDTAQSIALKEETSGTVIITLYLAANSAVQITFRGKLKLAVADKKITATPSSASHHTSILAGYHSEA